MPQICVQPSYNHRPTKTCQLFLPHISRVLSTQLFASQQYSGLQETCRCHGEHAVGVDDERPIEQPEQSTLEAVSPGLCTYPEAHYPQSRNLQ